MNNKTSSNKEYEFDLTKLSAVFTNYWAWIILVVFVFVAVAAFFTTFFIQPTWSSSVKFYVFIDSTYISGPQTTGEQAAAETHAKSAMAILQTAECKRQLGIAGKGATITATKVSDVPIFTVKVTANDNIVAYEIAQTIREKLPEYVFEKTNTGLLSGIDGPDLDEYHDSPNFTQNILIAGLIGFVCAYIFFLLRIVLDTQLHTEEDVKNIISYPILGGIPTMGSDAASKNYYYSRYSRYYDYSGYSNRSEKFDK